MTKRYNSPMLQIVGIKQSDVIATSTKYGKAWDGSSTILGADRFRDFEDYSE